MRVNTISYSLFDKQSMWDILELEYVLISCKKSQKTNFHKSEKKLILKTFEWAVSTDAVKCAYGP